MRRTTRRMRRRIRRTAGEDVNPMNYVSNLSDVMLILAVGIMLALILHWNVNIDTSTESTGDDSSTVTFDDSDLENKEGVPDSAELMGNVFYDPDTGKYYIVKENE